MKVLLARLVQTRESMQKEGIVHNCRTYFASRGSCVFFLTEPSGCTAERLAELFARVLGSSSLLEDLLPSSAVSVGVSTVLVPFSSDALSVMFTGYPKK